jgi:uncharacterized protein (TIRG00374 family)
LKKNIFTAIKIIFFIAIGFLFVWLFLKDLDSSQIQQIKDSFSKANYWWLLLSFFIGLLSHVLRTLRWKMLLQTIGYEPRFKNTFLSLMIGYFANLAIPRLGEVSRCTILTKYEKIPFEKSFGTVIAERGFDIITFLILFFVNLVYQYNKISGYINAKVFVPFSEKFTFVGKGYFLYGLVIILILGTVFTVVFQKRLLKFRLYQKIIKILRGFWAGLKSLAKIKKPLLFIVYTLLIWVMYFLMTYVCFYCFSYTSNPGLLAVLSVFIMGTIAIMVVQGGIGIYPVLVAGTLTLYGITDWNVKNLIGFALGCLMWGSQTFIIIIAGLISLILLPVLNSKPDVTIGEHK